MKLNIVKSTGLEHQLLPISPCIMSDQSVKFHEKLFVQQTDRQNNDGDNVTVTFGGGN